MNSKKITGTITKFLKRPRNEEAAISHPHTDEILTPSQRNKKFLREHFPPRDDNYKIFYDLLDALNSRQLLALSELTLGNNLFVTGCAGTGKTLWMRAAIALMQGLNKNVAVTATTALAASNIDVLPLDEVPDFEKPKILSQTGAAKKARLEKMKPTKMIDLEISRNFYVTAANSKFRKRVKFDIIPRTLHSWAGIGIDKFDPITLANEIKTKQTNFFTKARKRWQYTDVLFMDEVSMLDPVLFCAIDVMGRYIRMDERPFGGIIIVIVADFFQLPPVLKGGNRVALVEAEKIREELLQEQLDKRVEDEQKEKDNTGNDDDDDDDEKDKEKIIQAELAADEEYNRELARKQRDTERASASIMSRKTERELLLVPVKPEHARCCFQTLLWKESIKSAVVFNEIFRQNNPVFIDILAELRRGVVSSSNIALLEARTRYRLTNDLMQIAQQLFGNRNCDYLRAMSAKMFQVMRNLIDAKKSIFEQCEINVQDNFSSLASNSFIENPTIVHANWDRMLKHVKQCAAQTDFDPETALIYYLPVDHVPASHMIIVSEIEPTNIMSLNEQVDQCNERKLAAIKSPLVTFSAGISIGMDAQSHHFIEAQEHFEKEFKKNLTPLHLRLKIGAQVLLTSNLAPRFYNGRRGVIIDFQNLEEYQEKYGKDALLLPRNQGDEGTYPIVLFDNGAIARIGRNTWERKRAFGNNPKPIIGTLSQIPLMLAFAITIHKSQGMTIERLSVNLTSAFESGLPYVALSRGVNLESIVIEHLDRSIFDGSQTKFLPPPFVVAFYEKLEEEMDSFQIIKE